MTPRKQNEHSNDFRELVIKHFLNGNSEREIIKMVSIPHSSFHYIRARYKSTKCIGHMIGQSRKRKTTPHVDRCIRRKIMVNP